MLQLALYAWRAATFRRDVSAFMHRKLGSDGAVVINPCLRNCGSAGVLLAPHVRPLPNYFEKGRQLTHTKYCPAMSIFRARKRISGQGEVQLHVAGMGSALFTQISLTRSPDSLPYSLYGQNRRAILEADGTIPIGPNALRLPALVWTRTGMRIKLVPAR